MDKDYPIAVIPESPENGGGFVGYVADLPGCMGYGATQEEALADARDAIGEWLDEARAQEWTVPEPGAAAQAVIAERRTLIERLNQQKAALDAMQREVRQIQDQYEALLAVATESLSEPSIKHVSAVAIMSKRLEHSVQ